MCAMDTFVKMIKIQATSSFAILIIVINSAQRFEWNDSTFEKVKTVRKV